MPEIAVAWYSREEWMKVKASAADVEIFDDTWEEWLAQAQRTMRKIRKQMTVVRIPVTAAALQAWCWAEGLPNTSGNRALYAAQRLERMRASGRKEV